MLGELLLVMVTGAQCLDLSFLNVGQTLDVSKIILDSTV